MHLSFNKFLEVLHTLRLEPDCRDANTFSKHEIKLLSCGFILFMAFEQAYRANVFPLQSLSIHLTSTKGPIEVLLCPDEENDPRTPVKSSDTDINGNSPFLKVLQGLFLKDVVTVICLLGKKMILVTFYL